MRQRHPHVALGELCALFGVTRQAYYESLRHAERTSIAHMIVFTLVKEIRQEIPYLGTRKLIYMMEPKLIEHQIKMGRDQLFDLLRFHGLLIRCRKRIARTTDSNHLFKRYPNLIKDLVITDAYSRKIVGYALHPTLEASGCIKALSMAISNWKHESPFYLIHHSDRGIQYCCAEYTELLRRYGIAISMTQNGNPYDNSLAERVNGILKNEFYPKRIYQNHQDAWKSITKIVGAYNQLRPHASVDYLTPNQAHQQKGEIRKRWKKYARKKIHIQKTD